MRNAYRTRKQTRVGLSNGQVTAATRRHLVAVSASGLYKNRELLENGGSWTKNVYRTPIANRGRPIEWSSYFCYASPPSGGFRFRSASTTTKIANYSRTVATGREMSTKHQSKSGSAYRMVKLLSPRAAT
jgi:hypothetical protein